MSNELQTVNALRENVDSANKIFAEIAPLKEVFDAEIAKLDHLNREMVYFGVNEDGTATVLDFNGQGGAPRFTRAVPLPPAPAPVVLFTPEDRSEISEDFGEVGSTSDANVTGVVNTGSSLSTT